jgi:acyl carrier protein
MPYRQAITKFIEENLVRDGRGVKFEPDDNLIEEGIIDSMGLMQVIQFIEEHAGVRVPDDQVLPENFQTILSIEQLVENLRAKNK